MKIKITRTSTVEYVGKDQDLNYYRDYEIFNTDQIALYDLEQLEEENFDLDDIEGGEVEHSYKAVLVDDQGNEHEIDKNNTARDWELFPKDEGEEDKEPHVPEAGNLQ